MTATPWSAASGDAFAHGGDLHDRAYMQSRLREEIDRSQRYGRHFALLIFEALPSDGIPVRSKVAHALEAIATVVRASDVVARAFDDTLAVLLVEADARGSRDALFRIRNRITRAAGHWQITLYHCPGQREAIEALPLLTAA